MQRRKFPSLKLSCKNTYAQVPNELHAPHFTAALISAAGNTDCCNRCEPRCKWCKMVRRRHFQLVARWCHHRPFCLHAINAGGFRCQRSFIPSSCLGWVLIMQEHLNKSGTKVKLRKTSAFTNETTNGSLFPKWSLTLGHGCWFIH